MTDQDSKRNTKGRPNHIDVHVGKRLKITRCLNGLSQEKLAEAVGLTFQQVQKYERGVNRISAGKLHEFAELFEVDVLHFYKGLPRKEPDNTKSDTDENIIDVFSDKVFLTVAKDIAEMKKISPEFAEEMKGLVRKSLRLLKKQNSQK